jgi:DNA-binding HxlR family transcriptional regulator
MENKRKNKDFNPHNCGVTHFLNKIGGKWKVLIIYGISKNQNRFSLLRKVMPDISKQMLVNQLRELEDDKIIERAIYAEIPPRVEYKITNYGQTLMPVISVIQEWGLKDMNNLIETPLCGTLVVGVREM